MSASHIGQLSAHQSVHPLWKLLTFTLYLLTDISSKMFQSIRVTKLPLFELYILSRNNTYTLCSFRSALLGLFYCTCNECLQCDVSSIECPKVTFSSTCTYLVKHIFGYDKCLHVSCADSCATILVRPTNACQIAMLWYLSFLLIHPPFSS